MSGSDTSGGGFAYSAFISYSRSDAAFARWLHRRLEAFSFPAYDSHGGERKKTRYPLRPAFRDLDELAASGDLAQSIRDALAASNAMVLICSPDAARSEWVNREVEHFIALGRGDRILPVLVGGDPGTAFPPALAKPAREPLWVDARRGSESRERVFARIAAGLLNVTFDQVWRRKQRAGRARAIALSIAAALVAAPLAYAGYEMTRPVAMSQCPIDSIRFVNAWTRDVFEAKRVGARLYYDCPDGVIAPDDYVEANHLTPDTMCRGPYGQYVFDGVLTRNAGPAPPVSTDVRWVYNTIRGVPCCFWDAPLDETLDEIASDETFRWYPASGVPTLESLQMPVAGVEFGGDSTVETDAGLIGHTFAASVCRKDIVRDFGINLRNLGRGVMNMINPPPIFDPESDIIED